MRVLLRFRSGAVAKVVTAFAAGRSQDHSVRIYGRDASIENNLLLSRQRGFSMLARPTLHQESWGGLSVSRRIRKALWGAPSVVLGLAFEALMHAYRRRDSFEVNSFPMRLYQHDLAVRASVENFLQAVRTGCPPACTFRDAARTVVTCLAGVEALRTGRPVKVADHWLPELDQGS